MASTVRRATICCTVRSQPDRQMCRYCVAIVKEHQSHGLSRDLSFGRLSRHGPAAQRSEKPSHPSIGALSIACRRCTFGLSVHASLQLLMGRGGDRWLVVCCLIIVLCCSRDFLRRAAEVVK